MKAKQYLHKIQIKNQQRSINKAYQKHGLTYEIVKNQIELNQKKNQLNISNSEKQYENYIQ